MTLKHNLPLCLTFHTYIMFASCASGTSPALVVESFLVSCLSRVSHLPLVSRSRRYLLCIGCPCYIIRIWDIDHFLYRRFFQYSHLYLQCRSFLMYSHASGTSFTSNDSGISSVIEVLLFLCSI